jgi:hypothetical protein
MNLFRSTELVQLRAALDSKRNHILDSLSGLDDRHLRIAALPSGWTPLELLRHLTLGGERYWFSSIIGGEDLDWMPTEPRADWHVDADHDAASIVDAYSEQIAVSNTVLDDADPDDPPQRRDPRWDSWGIDFPNVRIIVVHMIVETATHAGHLDAVVELIDGRQHLVLD